VACHPVGHKALDPRTKTPIDCITCHNPMEAQFPNIMRLDGSKELCNQCHKY
jgi:predicted CXXCH cytochrome family protein